MRQMFNSKSLFWEYVLKADCFKAATNAVNSTYLTVGDLKSQKHTRLHTVALKL